MEGNYISSRPVQFFLEKCLKLHSGVQVKNQLHANFFTFGHYLTTPLGLRKFGFLGQFQQKVQNCRNPRGGVK